jgi:hypothetical protein
VKARAVIEIENMGEAAAWLATYTCVHTPAIRALREERGWKIVGARHGGVDDTAIAQAAVAKLAAYFGIIVGERPPGYAPIVDPIALPTARAA